MGWESVAVGNFTIWHWLVLAIMLVMYLGNLVFIPAVRRAGFSGWWVVLSIVPMVGLILLWVFAYVRWPIETDDDQRTFPGR